MTDKFQQARHLYMTGAKTQKEIAEIVGVTERTIYNWIHQFAWEKLKQASYAAPAIISGNLCSQLVEMQNEIAAREPGKRFPTIQEAEITRKLVTCIEKLKKYPSLPQNMQMLQTFRDFVRPRNEDFSSRIGHYTELFIEANAKNGFCPYELEYGMEQVSPVTPFYEEEEQELNKPHNEQRSYETEQRSFDLTSPSLPKATFEEEKCSFDLTSPSLPKATFEEEKRSFDLTSPSLPRAIVEGERPGEVEIIDNKGGKPGLIPFPPPEKTGKFPEIYPHEEMAEFNRELKKMELLNQFVKNKFMQSPSRAGIPPGPPRNQPCSCGSGKKYKHCHGKSG